MACLVFFFYIYFGHTKETCDGRSNYSPSCLEIALSLSTMSWHSPEGSLLPTARPWLCLSGASGRGKAESSWLAQTVWGLALQPRLPRRCWVGLGWQPPCCYFSEVISEINHRTLSRGEGGLGHVQGDCRSQCWGCEPEVRAEASQQGRAGHQQTSASVSSLLSYFWEALLELQPGASLGLALAEHRGHNLCITCVWWPWAITVFANSSWNLRGADFSLTAWLPFREAMRIFPIIPSKQPMLVGGGVWQGFHTFPQANTA